MVPSRTTSLPHPAIAGYLVAAGAWVAFVALGLTSPPVDAMNFYDHLADPYAVHDYASGQGFYYAPPVALAMRALALFGPHLFAATLVAIGLGALLWIGGRWAWALLLFPPVWWDLSSGNVNILLGAATVAMVARPGWVAPLVLTKVTPGVVGLWWAVRGEWGAVRQAALVTGAIVVVSAVIVPGWWVAWAQGLLSNGAGYTGPGYFTIPLPVVPRLAAAVLLVVWGARTGRPWVLPLAGCLALPVLWWTGLAMLAGMVRAPAAAWRATAAGA